MPCSWPFSPSTRDRALRMRLLALLFAVTLLDRSTTGATEWDARVSLPLNEHYRPGRYMPLRVTAGAAQRLRVEGDGIVPVAIDAGGHTTDTVVPVLVIGT